ncbi:Las1-like-domain-containing protein [Talaromyces proteolyticus]|uniref:Las1-like-domain-containing protein n=1 Tax=Talaromyces proteolyticus TaxID=1131652 RepID=A0AAD4Q691_9EURO|nr:Las1-like-domain-containing protein [Talaromyces proteolyticus]KAH8705403.1 Las1-like-domain-containing protein [Talaromyces proteolyticus]
MPKLSFTPWRDSLELLSIRSQFYPPSSSAPDLRRNACRTVEAWKLRGHLPHTVEATALLTDAILHDDAARNSVFSIRATYAAAFCRFVTGLVDSKLGGLRRTMFQRALHMGLPASFVELRHEATHRELPSLVVLRSAVHRSLEWLWGYYWVRIDGAAPVAAENGGGNGNDYLLGGTRGQIKQSLQHLLQADPAPAKKKARAQAVSVVSQSLIRICESESDGPQVLARVLLEDDILIPSERGAGTSIDGVFSTWDSLLQKITESRPSFLTVLMEEMALDLIKSGKSNTNTSSEEADSYAEGVYMWLDHIVTSVAWEGYRLYISVSYLRAICREMSNRWTVMLEQTLSNMSSVGEVEDSTANGRAVDFDIYFDDGWETLGMNLRPIGVESS